MLGRRVTRKLINTGGIITDRKVINFKGNKPTEIRRLGRPRKDRKLLVSGKVSSVLV